MDKKKQFEMYNKISEILHSQCDDPKDLQAYDASVAEIYRFIKTEAEELG